MRYPVNLPNGHTLNFRDEKSAERAQLMARALAAMPVSEEDRKWGHTNVGMYGQQSKLARELGYFTPSGRPDHTRIYNWLMNGWLPTKPGAREKLKQLAATIPDDWFQKCQCLIGEEHHNN